MPVQQPGVNVAWLGALALTWLFLAIRCYVGAGAKLRREGGAVSTVHVTPGDVFTTAALMMLMIGLGAMSFATAAAGDGPKFKVEQVLPGTLMSMIPLAGVAIFLGMRRVSVERFAGVAQEPAWRLVGKAAGFFAAALPLVLGLNLAMAQVLKEAGAEQDLVSLFKEVSSSGNVQGIVQMIFAAAILAPLNEELLFRGYFYPTLRRYIGAIPSALLTAAVFAGIHGNVAALPGLMLLALCFTMALEVTGSIWVCVGMHALFNGVNLAMLYVVATRGLG